MDVFFVVVIGMMTITGYIVGRLHEVIAEMKARESLRRTVLMVRSYILCTSQLTIGYHEIAEAALDRLLPDDEHRTCLDQELQALDVQLEDEASKIKEYIEEMHSKG